MAGGEREGERNGERQVGITSMLKMVESNPCSPTMCARHAYNGSNPTESSGTCHRHACYTLLRAGHFLQVFKSSSLRSEQSIGNFLSVQTSTRIIGHSRVEIANLGQMEITQSGCILNASEFRALLLVSISSLQREMKWNKHYLTSRGKNPPASSLKAYPRREQETQYFNMISQINI